MLASSVCKAKKGESTSAWMVRLNAKLAALSYPQVISPKLDGVRGVVGPAGLLSRKLLRIPNSNVQDLLEGLPIGLDGELLVGDPTAPDVYRKTVSVVMSDNKPADDVVYHVFDIQEDRPWEERYARLREICGGLKGLQYIRPVPQVMVWSLEELLSWEDKWVGQGYEGVILRAPGSPYKHDRSTEREGFLLKLKRFVDSEARVIGMTELMHNANGATKDETGHTKRGHQKAGMEPVGTMGTLIVRDVVTGVEFEIGTGFTAAERADIWARWQTYNQALVIGFQLVKYKHFPSGAKDKPRYPVFLGWRDSRDT